MAQDKAERLLHLAKREFEDLTPAEEKLFKHVANGEPAIYTSNIDAKNDPAKSDEWGPERVLRAKCITWLCTNPQASKLVTHRGIQVKGVRIDGKLDLMFVRLSFPLTCAECAFPKEIDLRHAKIAALYLTGSHTGPISADGLELTAALNLCEGFRAKGEVRLIGATIGGDLVCRNGNLIGKQHNVEGSKKKVVALSADGASVRGSVYFDGRFRAKGEVRLSAATIDGYLICTNGQFTNKDGNALSADGASVNGDVHLDDDFQARGEVCLVGATIGGNLNCRKGLFLKKGYRALNADGLKVKGNVYLRSGFKAEGKVSFPLAQIDGAFVWTATDSPELASLDLRLAKIGTLWDDKNSWPKRGDLALHGLVYDQLDDHAPTDAKSRIDWLSRQGDHHFRPQPYEQLAEVLRKSGHDSDARKILVQKNKDRRRLTKLTFWSKVWYYIFGPIIGYGYRLGNALWLAAAIIALGWLFFGIGHNLITPCSESAYVQTYKTKGKSQIVVGKELSDVHPKLNFLIYSIDSFVPLVDLYQTKYWLPNANRGNEWFSIASFTVRTGGILRLYFWFHTASGWILTTLLIVGLTRIIRR